MNSNQRRKNLRRLERAYGQQLDIILATARLLGKDSVHVPTPYYQANQPWQIMPPSEVPVFAVRDERLYYLRRMAGEN